MKNKFYKLFLVILLLPLLILNVKADTIDPTRNNCKIIGLYKSGETLLTDTKVSVYKIANVDTSGQFTYVDSFAAAGYELNGLTSTQLTQLLNNLDKYIETKNIEPTKSANTDSAGEVTFTDLGTGFYLVKTDLFTKGDYTYQGKNLVSIPNLNENTNTYMYEIEMLPKIKTDPIVKPDDSGNNNNNNNENKSNIPNTYDSIYMYFGIFFITILVIGMIVYYISKTKRSEE